MPAALMSETQASALNFVGLNGATTFALYSASGDLFDAHEVLGVAGDGLAVPLAAGAGVDAPVDEAAEFGVAPPGEALVAGGGGGFVPGLFRLLDGGAVTVGGLGREGKNEHAGLEAHATTFSARSSLCGAHDEILAAFHAHSTV